MALAPRPWASDILQFWFRQLGPGDWFTRSGRLDAMLARRFGGIWQALRKRPAHEFLADPLTARAAVLLFDQVPRNIFRDSARAFASDPLARLIAREALLRGWDAGLSGPERQFLAMPLMHSEAIADQRASIAYYATLPRHGFAFARAHYRMVARFGRFPHRNAVLGRRSTPAEQRAVAARNSR